MKLKAAPARFKAGADDAGLRAGEFEAIVSVFGVVDSYGDVVLPGAFTNTIAAWKSSADRLPVLWNHRMDDPAYNIGEVIDLVEFGPEEPGLPDWVDPAVRAGGGLWVKARIDTGPDASPIAVQTLRLLKARRVSQFSYAYDEVKAGPVTVGGADAWGLHELKIYEVGPTQVGVNEHTELLAAKAAAAAAGRAVPDRTDEREREEPAEPVKREGVSMGTVRLLSDLARLEGAIQQGT